MTPARLAALVAAALNRQPTRLELEVWGEALACPPHVDCPPVDCVHDSEADTALRLHYRGSTYPPTPADVRKLAVDQANRRVEACEHAQRERDQDLAVPPTPEYLAAKAEWDRQQALRARQLEGDLVDEAAARQARLNTARAAADAELASSGVEVPDQVVGSPT